MTDNRKIALDYVTEWQTNDTPWLEFEWHDAAPGWNPCNIHINPTKLGDLNILFRRRPRTITVTIPVPTMVYTSNAAIDMLHTGYANEVGRDLALSAIRQAMEKAND